MFQESLLDIKLETYSRIGKERCCEHLTFNELPGVTECTWKMKLCRTTTKLLKADILGEASVLQESFRRLVDFAEDRDTKSSIQLEHNSMLLSCERKASSFASNAG